MLSFSMDRMLFSNTVNDRNSVGGAFLCPVSKEL